MRLHSLVMAGCLLLAGSQAAQAQAVLKIGYVNSASILEQAPGAQEASQQFERDLQGYQAEIQRMSDELQGMIEQFDRQQITLSPTAKAQREGEIRRKQQEFQTRVDAIEGQASERQRQLVQPVMDRVTRVIDQLRADGNYTLIFDVAAGSIIAADPALDLTEEVIRRLRASASGGR